MGAHSPQALLSQGVGGQAKGRIERSHGIQQDRLVKELRLRGLSTAEEANRYLRQHYLAEHHRRFRRQPASAKDYHRKAPSKGELDKIFRLEEERTIPARRDWVVRYRGRFLQIQRESRYAPAGSKVMVTEGRDGRLKILYRDHEVQWRQIPAPAARQQPEKIAKGTALELRKKLHRPASDHPWKKWKPCQQGQGVEPVPQGGTRFSSIIKWDISNLVRQ